MGFLHSCVAWAERKTLNCTVLEQKTQLSDGKYQVQVAPDGGGKCLISGAEMVDGISQGRCSSVEINDGVATCTIDHVEGAGRKPYSDKRQFLLGKPMTCLRTENLRMPGEQIVSFARDAAIGGCVVEGLMSGYPLRCKSVFNLGDRIYCKTSDVSGQLVGGDSSVRITRASPNCDVIFDFGRAKSGLRKLFPTRKSMRLVFDHKDLKQLTTTTDSEGEGRKESSQRVDHFAQGPVWAKTTDAGGVRVPRKNTWQDFLNSLGLEKGDFKTLMDCCSKEENSGVVPECERYLRPPEKTHPSGKRRSSASS
jgi:hypothetical protein